MPDKVFSVLFLCTGNSARSILAEGLMSHLGKGRFRAHSAGSHPTGKVNPWALATLQQLRIPIDGFRSKSWDEFAAPTSEPFDFVLTVCDSAAAEICPVWPGQPLTAHWGVPDPAAVAGTDDEKSKAFMTTALTLRRRIELMLALPLDDLQSLALKGRLDDIGREGA